jgi:hypothetical protein
MRHAPGFAFVLLLASGCTPYRVQVVDESSGQPLANVRLRAQLADPLGAPTPFFVTTTRTDASGRAVGYLVRPWVFDVDLVRSGFEVVPARYASPWDGVVTFQMRPVLDRVAAVQQRDG